MRIQALKINNYKSMYNPDQITIGQDIYAFIGQNNAGKSTILDAIQCVFPSADKKIEDTDFHKRNEDVVIEIHFSDVTEDYLVSKFMAVELEKHEKDMKACNDRDARPDEIANLSYKFLEKRKKTILRFSEKYELENDSFIVRLIVPFGGKKKYEIRTPGNSISEADLSKILPQLTVIPAIRNPKNESTAGTKSYMKDLIQMLDDEMQTTIKFQNENVSYKDLNDILAEASNERCKELSDHLTAKYADALGDNSYRIQINSNVNISKGTSYSTKIIDCNTNLESDMTNCGTGYQSMVILSILETYVELSKKMNFSILIIEEPEVYLHPSLQRRMISTLLKFSESNQVLFSTHSPITISPLDKNQISLVVKENGKAHVEDINVKTVIEELGVRPDDIFSKDHVIFVEGPDDKQVVEILLEKIHSGLSEKINVVNSGNCENIRFYANAAQLLNGNYEKKMLIIRDADSKDPDEQKRILVNEISKLNNDHAFNREKFEKDIFIVGKHSLESLFMDENILEKMTSMELETLRRVVISYNSVYDKMSGKMAEKEFAKYFQPKYFFEKNLDQFGYSDEKQVARGNWDAAYKNKWQGAFENDDEYEEFMKVREAVNSYTLEACRARRNYLADLVEEMTLDQLKGNLFAGLVERLEEFVEV